MNIEESETNLSKNIENKEQEGMTNTEIKAPFKINKPKRNPFEKVIDDSITLCNHILECEDNFLNNFESLLDKLSKEIHKKEEFFQMMKLFERMKFFHDSMPINLEDTQKINNFTEYKSTLEDIKNILDNKKKINKSTNDIEMTKEVKSDTAMIVDCTERENSTKKKKKESRKRLKEKIDTSEIVKKIKEDSKLYEGELKDQNENPEVKGPDETIHPLSPKANPVDFKNESGKKIIIGTSEKKAKAERNNQSITNYFKEKTIVTSQLGSNNPSIASSVVKNSTNTHKPLIKDIAFTLENSFPSYTCPLIYSHSNSYIAKIEYENQYVKDKFLTSKVEFDFYNIKGNEINNIEEYTAKFKNHIQEISKEQKEKNYQSRKRKLVFIHDSFVSYKKPIDKTSHIINPRNPFKKDEFILDYDKDSEEEYMEENAEDIKSKDNSDEEEDVEEDEQEGEQWIVPDNHLSEDEISEKDILADRIKFEENKERLKGMMEILDVRKSYAKPVYVDFRAGNLDVKRKFLQEKLCAGIYNPPSAPNSVSTNETLMFPIKIESSASQNLKNKIAKDNIKEKLPEVVNEIHGSYFTKEHLINHISENYSLSKLGLSKFFKEKVLKLKVKNKVKKILT